ncbi:MAG: helix-turn-helix domain-containing protein [Methanobrevibacter sp.]|nr:helix-turn-helix domain-containing protein [Methanobrevibacter sp.]
MDKETVKCIAYVKASKYRKDILLEIDNDLKLPSEISKEVSIRINHVSNTLKQLKDANLVECVNEEAKKGRLYQTTEKGKGIIEYLTKKI